MFRTSYYFHINEDDKQEKGPEHYNLDVKDKHGHVVANVSLCWGDESLDRHSIELLKFSINDEFEGDIVKLGHSMINSIFKNMDWVQRIYLMSNKENSPYWRKLGFAHIDNNFYYRNRH